VNWKLLIAALFFFGLSWSIKGQSTLLGVSGLYNFQTESAGVGMRWNMLAQKKLSLSLQTSYYLPFFKVNELNFGLALQYQLIQVKKLGFYSLAHSGYNRWISFEKSHMKNAQMNNWNAEIGAGVYWKGKVRPFLEWRYNVRFQEAHVQWGVMLPIAKGKGNHEKCAAYN
jgi:hypothetical protein